MIAFTFVGVVLGPQCPLATARSTSPPTDPRVPAPPGLANERPELIFEMRAPTSRMAVGV